MSSVRLFCRCFWNAIIDVVKHDGIEHAGYLAFLGMLSLFPFLVFFGALVGFITSGIAPDPSAPVMNDFLTRLHIKEEFANLLVHNLPPGVITALEPRILEILSGPSQGLLTVAIIGTIWTASSMVEGLRTILNRAYRVGTPPAYIWRRLLSILQFFIFTGISILTLMFFVITPIIWEKLSILLFLDRLMNSSWMYVRFGMTGLILFLAVAWLYFIVPNIKQRFTMVLPGAFLVVIGWMGAASLLSGYIQHFNQVNLVYGSLGGIIAAMLFFYLLATVVIFGAEFNYHLEVAQGHKLIEKEAAING